MGVSELARPGMEKHHIPRVSHQTHLIAESKNEV